MSFTVEDAIAQVRSVHPAFSRYMVPDKSLADFFTREQRRLMTLAIMRDRQYLAQSMSILFDLSNADADAPGTAGAGTSGGVPAESDGAGGYREAQATTGAALTVDDGTVFVDDTAVTAGTATTADLFGVTWVANVYAGKMARIVAGYGAGTSPRPIASNTIGGHLVVSSAWEITPNTTSVIRIVEGDTAFAESIGVVTDLPSTTQTRGYLVRLDASGVPYLDVTAPLVAHVARGVPLPAHHVVLGGTVRFGDASAQTDFDGTPLTLVSEAMRFRSFRYAAFMRGQTLVLVGNRSDWTNVASIELAYVPIPPAFTARTDLFLLPDTALPVLVAKGAVFAASRIAGLEGVPQPPSDLLVQEAIAAEATYAQTISLTKRARLGRVRPRYT